MAAAPTVFSAESAIVELGVGKNMVASIRYWCEATGLIATTDGLRGSQAVTGLGQALLSPSGWDPFLEDVGTLWLLQWQLTRPHARTSTWHLAFTRWNRAVFTRDDLVGWLLKLTAQLGISKVSPASLRRDVDAFLRTYIPQANRAWIAEDSFDCPLAELGLLEEVEDAGLYQFRRSEQVTLPSHVLAYAVLDYWSAAAPGQETLSFERLMFGPGSPGGAFQLSEAGLVTHLEQLPSKAHVRYDESAGLRRLVRTHSTRRADPAALLDAYYHGRA